jgi:hypothetical protein
MKFTIAPGEFMGDLENLRVTEKEKVRLNITNIVYVATAATIEADFELLRNYGGWSELLVRIDGLPKWSMSGLLLKDNTFHLLAEQGFLQVTCHFIDSDTIHGDYVLKNQAGIIPIREGKFILTRTVP